METLTIYFLLQKWSPKVHKKQSLGTDFARKFVPGSYRQVFQLLIEFSTFITRVGLRDPGTSGRRSTDTLTQAKHRFMIFSCRNAIFNFYSWFFNFYSTFSTFIRYLSHSCSLALWGWSQVARKGSRSIQSVRVGRRNVFSTLIRDFSTFIKRFQL